MRNEGNAPSRKSWKDLMLLLHQLRFSLSPHINLPHGPTLYEFWESLNFKLR
jgi:hypothetical protein